MGAESIPGCVLQCYIWLSSPELAGLATLVSILISAATTGTSSAIIAFDKDVDEKGRKEMPQFYGYIPDDHSRRRMCFLAMTTISALHNLSRSVGYALLAKSGGTNLAALVIGGEILLFLLFKIIRRDFMYWPRVDGFLGITLSLLVRIIFKIIVDFSGCLQFRHP